MTNANFFGNRQGLPPVESPPRNLTGPKNAQRRNRSTILDLFPEARTFSSSIRSLFIPSGAPLAGAQQVGWYGMASFDLVDVIGMEGALAAARFTLSPTYYNDPTDLQWGDKYGDGAAIIIGLNLPVREGEWSVQGCSAAAVRGTNVTRDRSYIHVETFPPGSYGDTLPIKATPMVHFGGGLHRVRATDRLDVAFVLNQTQFNAHAEAGAVINVRASVELFIMPTKINTNFTNL